MTGFNCGEAANFATPQWLKFAKDAAVRRAAMNYLPMLSHQQLLYMLTVSFISRSVCDQIVVCLLIYSLFFTRIIASYFGTLVLHQVWAAF